jgi:hypothetical protein
MVAGIARRNDGHCVTSPVTYMLAIHMPTSVERWVRSLRVRRSNVELPAGCPQASAASTFQMMPNRLHD